MPVGACRKAGPGASCHGDSPAPDAGDTGSRSTRRHWQAADTELSRSKGIRMPTRRRRGTGRTMSLQRRLTLPMQTSSIRLSRSSRWWPGSALAQRPYIMMMIIYDSQRRAREPGPPRTRSPGPVRTLPWASCDHVTTRSMSPQRILSFATKNVKFSGSTGAANLKGLGQ